MLAHDPLTRHPLWLATDAWRRIDFVSDMHLCADQPRTFQAFERYLQTTPADAVVILGDLFEFWLGDDARHSEFEAQCTGLLAQASQKRCIAFMAGNRDFLLGPEMAQAAGMHLLPDPCILVAWQQRTLLTHGDAWCIDDTAYQRFRTIVRSPDWQQNFLGLPLSERRMQAQQMREKSRQHQQNQGATPGVDVDSHTAVHQLQTTQSSTLIHGHTHRPGSQMLAPGLTRHVLSDWDLDASHNPRAEVLTWGRSEWQRLPCAAD